MSGRRRTINDLLAAARDRLSRLEPAEAAAAARDGAVIVDIRSECDRERDGMGEQTVPLGGRLWAVPYSGLWV